MRKASPNINGRRLADFCHDIKLISACLRLMLRLLAWPDFLPPYLGLSAGDALRSARTIHDRRMHSRIPVRNAELVHANLRPTCLRAENAHLRIAAYDLHVTSYAIMSRA